MISAILNGDLDKVDYDQNFIFGLFISKYCSGVPTEILDPMNTWLQKGAYVRKAIQLVHSFHLNFEKFASQASEQIIEGGPLIDEHHHLHEHF